MAEIEKTAKAYVSTYKLIQMMCDLSDHVPVKWRRVLWEKSLDRATDMIAAIIYAYETRSMAERVKYIDRALTIFTVLNTYLRLCNENRAISTQKMTNISELMTDISQQLGAWRKSTAARLNNV